MGSWQNHDVRPSNHETLRTSNKYQRFSTIAIATKQPLVQHSHANVPLGTGICRAPSRHRARSKAHANADPQSTRSRQLHIEIDSAQSVKIYVSPRPMPLLDSKIVSTGL